jgi:Arc/MetJ family transcription regulator
MSRTNIDIDDAACAAVMDRYGLSSKRDAVNLALRLAAVEPLGTDRALALEGAGWVGDLDDMRIGRGA